MHVGHNLRLEQAQKLIMTPELRQAIALLQMSSLQLIEYVQDELTSNPVLEWEEGEEEKKEESSEKEETETQTKEEEFPWEEYFQENFYEASSMASPQKEESSNYSLENFCRREETFFDALFLQLRVLLEEQEQPLAEFLIGCLDANGYLRMKVDEIAHTLEVPAEQVEKVLEVMQHNLEPAGIGARDLRECLLLQLKRCVYYPPLAEFLVQDYLPAVADGRFSYLAEKFNVSLDELMEAVEFIKSLNPKPGSLLGPVSDTRYIVPDVLVEKVEGEYVITINDNVSPHLKINPYYRSLLQRQEGETTTFVKKCLERALWLVKSIEQRRLTLYRVTEYIVKVQTDFLERGLKHLQPLTLKEVAEALEMHESTVSRATANKYLQTPRGVFPFKFFFSTRVPGENGQGYSSTSIKTYLEEIINEEPSHRPHSDNKLAALLQDKGINISRRTVAKYREEMMIPASHKRRRS